ncbi:MAG: hypothetical protein U5J64_10460 [Halobacteriales archaeon]|nr:hypothetical protein [Halobacteriales archaeon]
MDAPTRRKFLLLVATCPSVAGCLGGGTSDARRAEEAVETLFTRVRDGDLEGANDMIADDRPIGELNESDTEEAEYVGVDTETVVVQDETAVVRVTLTYEPGDTDELEVGLRKIDGEWLVWEQLDT